MILTHGANSLEQKNPKLSRMLYLTYFDNFDVETKIDHPKIGNDCHYTVSGSFSIYTRELNGANVPFIGSAGSSGYNINSYLNVTHIPDVISCEWISNNPRAYDTSTGSVGGFQIIKTNPLSSQSIIGAKSYVSTNTGIEANEVNTTTYNGYTIDRDYTDSNYFGSYVSYFKKTNRFNQNIHYAVVFDTLEKKMYAYENGTLAVVNDFSSFSFSQLFLRLQTGCPANWQAYRTQFCVIEGDWSSDNRTTYPVPTKPYWNF